MKWEVRNSAILENRSAPKNRIEKGRKGRKKNRAANKGNEERKRTN